MQLIRVPRVNSRHIKLQIGRWMLRFPMVLRMWPMTGGGGQILDVSDPDSLSTIGSYPMPRLLTGIEFTDGLVFGVTTDRDVLPNLQIFNPSGQCGEPCLADLNGDGSLNFDDISASFWRTTRRIWPLISRRTGGSTCLMSACISQRSGPGAHSNDLSESWEEGTAVIGRVFIFGWRL